MIENPKKKNKQKIDILNEELYFKNKDFTQKKRRKIHERDIQLKHDFDKKEFEALLKKSKKRKLPTSFFKKIFFTTLFFFFMSALIAAFSLYEKKDRISSDLISMEMLGQPFVDGGENLELRVRIQNFNKQTLELPDLVLSYKKDSSLKEDNVFIRRSLPNIENGNKVDEKFDLLLFGKEGDVRNIHARLEYRIEGSTSIFVKKIDHEVVIRSTPVKISIEAPEEIVQGQEIPVSLRFSSNSTKTLHNLLLSVSYPLGFEFISSNKEPDYGNHTWYIPSLSREEELIQFKGKLSGFAGQAQSFHVKIGKQNQEKKDYIETTFAEITQSVDIKKSFLETFLEINGSNKSRVSIRGGGDIEVRIGFKNTLDKQLNEVNIIAHILGSLHKKDGVYSANGDYNSNSNNIIWDKNNLSELETLNPGDKSEVNFTLHTKDLVNSSGSLLNPNTSIVVDISAIDGSGKLLKAKSIVRADVVANSDLRLIAKTLHNDGHFKNFGPIPPRVGQVTRYTLTFQISNSSNPIKNAQLSTRLPSYVHWVGDISPTGEKNNIMYNKDTREIIWNLGELSPGLGVGIKKPREISFQVDLLPSLSHVDTLPKLTNDIILKGSDVFTGIDLEYKKTGLTTSLTEVSASVGDSRVKK